MSIFIMDIKIIASYETPDFVAVEVAPQGVLCSSDGTIGGTATGQDPVDGGEF